MRLLLILCVLTTIITPTGEIILGAATVWPESLDELFQLIEDGEGNWVFTTPCPKGEPLITWQQIKVIAFESTDGDAGRLTISSSRLNEIISPFRLNSWGTFDVSEDAIFSVGAYMALHSVLEGQPFTCKPKNDKVAIYGPIVQLGLDRLAEVK